MSRCNTGGGGLPQRSWEGPLDQNAASLALPGIANIPKLRGYWEVAAKGNTFHVKETLVCGKLNTIHFWPGRSSPPSDFLRHVPVVLTKSVKTEQWF